MKWTRSELLKNSVHVNFDEDVDVDSSEFEGNELIESVHDVHVSGSGYLDDDNDRFYCEIHVEGVMIVPDSITGDLIEYPFSADSNETYVLGETEEDDVRIVSDEVIDLTEAVVDDILLEVPLEVSDVQEGEYPEGDGWKVYSEAEYQESRKDQIDPRLAKLKQFKSE